MGDGIALWRSSRWPAGRWRRDARMAIVSVVDASGHPLPADILERVDAAHPFGQRKYQPYKEWLKERRLFIAAIMAPVMPSADEVAACEVARDLIEDGGDPAVLARLLDQAPNRLARMCPACGMPSGTPCYDASNGPRMAAYRLGNMGFPDLLVPHHARLVGRLDAGPLFTERTT